MDVVSRLSKVVRVGIGRTRFGDGTYRTQYCSLRINPRDGERNTDRRVRGWGSLDKSCIVGPLGKF